jgi:radical SAM protein with 4Fe4S-binding SPASM domain
MCAELYYMITTQCNQRCSKCSHWKRKDDSPRLPPQKIIEAVKALPGLCDLTIVGGEPLLFKEEILKIIKGIAATPVRTVIISNGVALSSEFIDEIKDYKIHIVVSIDTMDRNFWRFVRGVDSYNLVMKNLEYAIHALSPYQLSLQSVLAEETKSFLPEVKKFADAHGLYHSVQNFIAEGFDGFWTPIKTSEKPFSLDTQQCFAAGRNLSVMQNGNVYTCFQQSWIKGFERPLGNLNTTPIEQIIASSYAQAVQEAMKKCNKSCKELKCNLKR